MKYDEAKNIFRLWIDMQKKETLIDMVLEQYSKNDVMNAVKMIMHK